MVVSDQGPWVGCLRPTALQAGLGAWLCLPLQASPTLPYPTLNTGKGLALGTQMLKGEGLGEQLVSKVPLWELLDFLDNTIWDVKWVKVPSHVEVDGIGYANTLAHNGRMMKPTFPCKHTPFSDAP